MTSDPPLHVALGPDLRRLPVRLHHCQTQGHYARVQQDDAAEIQHCDWLVGLQIS